MITRGLLRGLLVVLMALLLASGGVALADRWGMPAKNRFISRRGHFSAGLAIAHDGGPMDRFAALLLRLGSIKKH